MVSLSHGRARRRGATMVEAAIVLPVLVLFFGLLLYVAKAQENRHQVQADAFREALAYASTACDGDGPRIRSPGIAFKGDDPPKLATDGAREMAAEGSLDRQFNAAHAQRAHTVTVGRLDSRTTSDARVLCNEKPIDGSAYGFFEYGIRTFNSYFPEKVDRYVP